MGAGGCETEPGPNFNKTNTIMWVQLENQFTASSYIHSGSYGNSISIDSFEEKNHDFHDLHQSERNSIPCFKKKEKQGQEDGGKCWETLLEVSGWGITLQAPNTGIISTQNTEPTGSGLGRDGKVIGA